VGWGRGVGGGGGGLTLSVSSTVSAGGGVGPNLAGVKQRPAFACSDDGVRGKAVWFGSG